MEFLLPLAAKSLLIAGGTLLLLKLMQRRSASDRSWIAHLGLVAVLLLPLGAIALPALEVVGPAFLAPATPESAISAPAAGVIAPEVAASPTPFPAADAAAPAGIEWALWTYAVPAALLLLLTLIALGRLGVLKSRANVLVDTHWLKALAKAQRRMGFKNGTALLTSDELSSPISWGLMRPVILLNTDATRARGEAEAIIAHELAHVARLDWAKLMLARVAVALFWFNPLVWLLSREAHQLREEAADDAVLAADIEDTEYANLLVGIARHECRGLLLGAHGVAPARNSLSRRVKRVLNAALERAPGGWRWSSAAAIFAAGMAVPVAALQIINPTIATASAEGRFVRSEGASAPAAAGRTHALAATAATAAAVASAPLANDRPQRPDVRVQSGSDMDVDVDVDPDVDIDPPNVTVRGPNVQIAVNGRSMGERISRSAIDRAVELRTVGAAPAYVAAMKNAAPHLRLNHDDIVQLRAVGVSPEYVRDLGRSGYGRLSADDIVEARAMGISGAYIRGMAAAGYGPLPMHKLVEMKAVGVTPEDVRRFRRANRGLPSVDRMVQVKALGLHPEDVPADGDE